MKVPTRTYEDIIGLPRPVSTRRTRISPLGRAAQFAPFAALNGYEAAIAETGRLTDIATEPMEGRAEAVAEGLRQIRQWQKEQPEVTVTFFEPDKRKAGGVYRTVTGRIRKFLEYERQLLLHDSTIVPFDCIYELTIRSIVV
jgi:hypothetical protein